MTEIPWWARRRARFRLRVLIDHWGLRGAETLAEALEIVDARLRNAADSDIWLALSVVLARLPTQDEFVEGRRFAAYAGVAEMLRLSLAKPRAGLFVRHGRRRPVVLSAPTLVDLDHTSLVQFATGIQRVTRETTRRWADSYEVTFVGWTGDRSALRRLRPDELQRALHGGPVDRAARNVRWRDREVVIPDGGRYILPELHVEPRAMLRLSGLARFSGLETAAIGFDAVPLTTAEVVDVGMPGKFTSYLAALKFFDRVVATSGASGVEFSGWRRMLAGSGVAGPLVSVVALPGEALGVGSGSSAEVDELVGEGPLVLCVGSHEPRKNHGAVLQAAELLWREGWDFSLLFVGGNSWGSGEFLARVERLRSAGRRVRVVSAVPDEVLGGLYRRARLTVFPSVNEGFGLPLVESLAVGTPVVTSEFGSMQEIVVAGGGGVLVDPRDDHDVARGMRELLTDDVLWSRLRAEALARPVRSWDEYAREAWVALNPSDDQ